MICDICYTDQNDTKPRKYLNKKFVLCSDCELEILRKLVLSLCKLLNEQKINEIIIDMIEDKIKEVREKY
jgi:hypothetical protein